MYDNMQKKHERIFEIGGAGTMERLKDKAYAHDAEAERYREKIVEVVGQINNPKFLKRIYISLREYMNESEPE